MGGAWCLAVANVFGMGWDGGGSHITEWFLVLFTISTNGADWQNCICQFFTTRVGLLVS